MNTELFWKAVEQNNWSVSLWLIRNSIRINQNYKEVNRLEEAISRYVNNTTNYHNKSYLLVIIKNDFAEIMQLLLEAEIVTIDETYNDSSLLMIAADYNAIEITKLLIENYIDINYISKHDRTALYHAVNQNSLEVVEVLLSSGADIIESKVGSPLTLAIKNNNIDIVKLMIDYKAIDMSSPLPLHYSCTNVTITQLLLQSGADILVENNYSIAPLIHSIQNGSKEVIECYLKSLEAIPSELLCNDMLLLAVLRDDTEIIQLLIDYNIAGSTAIKDNSHGIGLILIFCVIFGKLSLLKYLIEEIKIAINYPLPKKGQFQYLFLYAVAKRNIDIIKYLVEKNVNTKSKDQNGNNALHIAAHVEIEYFSHFKFQDEESVEVLEYLLKIGFTMNSLNNDKFNCVSLAAIHGNLTTFLFFIEKGATINDITTTIKIIDSEITICESLDPVGDMCYDSELLTKYVVIREKLHSMTNTHQKTTNSFWFFFNFIYT